MTDVLVAGVGCDGAHWCDDVAVAITRSKNCRSPCLLSPRASPASVCISRQGLGIQECALPFVGSFDAASRSHETSKLWRLARVVPGVLRRLEFVAGGSRFADEEGFSHVSNSKALAVPRKVSTATEMPTQGGWR